jgi:hypothetical protein
MVDTYDVSQVRIEAAIAQTDSAGQIAQDDGTAGSQNPNEPASVLTPEGRINPDNVESGTDDPTRTLQDTQGTPLYTESQLNNDQTGAIASDSNAVANPTSAGVGAGGDDTATAPKNATKQEIDNIFGSTGAIVPQSNILDQYASYTYQASVYLMKPESFAAMVKSKKVNLPGSQLLFQSGGAPVAGRNPYFSNDYYIDRFELKSAITGKGTNAAHNVNSIKMTLVEPNGITFIENLDKAVTAYLGTTGNPPKKKNFQSQLFLLVVRFYGYDDSGKLVQAGVNTTSGSTSTTPGAGAVSEKYYPFSLNAVKFKIANRLVEYEIEGSAVQYQIGTGQIRAVVPYNVELSGISVKEALLGNAVLGSTTTSSTTTAVVGNSTTVVTATATSVPRDETATTDPTPTAPAAPDKASAAPTPKLTVRQGLMAALNQYQQDKVKAGEITYPDTYTIVFVSNAIGQAQIKKAGQDKKATATQSGGTAAQQLDSNKQSVDTNSRTLNITAGRPLTQVIDQILKNSTYIEDQQIVKVLEESGKQVPNGAAAKNVAWFKISMEATPGKYDPLRNDYAYDIKYIVTPYKVNELVSNYFSKPKYNGVHKQYNYWFTGLNNSVLNYEQTYNSLYTQVMTGGPKNSATAAVSNVKQAPATASAQTSQGAKGRANEPAANAADYLYSPGDNNECVMSIVGDPAWLQQGEATFGINTTNFNYGGFLPDGTINYDSQQILFEVLINTPTDYNFNTGLMDPNTSSNTNNQSTTVSQPGQSRRSFIFLAKECVSEFVKGKFTQTLKGVLINQFANQTDKAASSRATSAATTALPSTGNSSRALNTSNDGAPGGNNSIPTEQPPFETSSNADNTIAPTSGTEGSSSSTGATTESPTNSDTVLASPPRALPASLATAPTSDGDIEAIRQFGAQPLPVNNNPQTPQEAAAAVAAVAATNDSGTIPAPPKLPSAAPEYSYEAKLNQNSQNQVNTTPPQLIVKEA